MVALLILAQESEMSNYTDLSMTNTHVHNLFAEVGHILHVWRERFVQRHELMQWTQRDMHDAGMSRGEVLYEAGKPFWRA
jgi:uncharacterized protein YjiS (DUF1127 family)